MFWLPELSFKALKQHLACTEFGSCRVLLLHCTSCMYHPGFNCSFNCQAKHSTLGIPLEDLWPHLACAEFSSRRVFVLRRTSCMYLPEANFDISCLYRRTFNIFRHFHAELAHSIAEDRRQKKMLGRTASQREEWHA